MKSNKQPIDYRKVVAGILKESPWLSSKELSEKMKIPRDTAYWYLRVMRDEGLVTARPRVGSTHPSGSNLTHEFNLVRAKKVGPVKAQSTGNPTVEHTGLKWAFPDPIKSERAKAKSNVAPVSGNGDATGEATVVILGVQIAINGKLQTLDGAEAERVYNELKKVLKK